MNDINLHFTKKAIEHLKCSVIAYSRYSGQPITSIVVTVILPPENDVLLLGFVPKEISVNDDDCYSLDGMKVFFDHPELVEKKLKQKYIDEMNGTLMIRRRGPGINIELINFEPFRRKG